MGTAVLKRISNMMAAVQLHRADGLRPERGGEAMSTYEIPRIVVSCVALIAPIVSAADVLNRNKKK